MNDPIYALLSLVDIGLSFYTFAIIARALISWVQPDPRNPIVQFLNRITDPVLRPIGRLIPPFGGLDITPLIAILLIQLVQNLLPV